MSKEKYLFAFILLIGCIFRLIFVEDMEYKYDESLMFEIAETNYDLKPYPKVGIKSGGGINNPGLSLWPFILFSSFSNTPVGLVRFVQCLNIISLLLFAYFFIYLFKEFNNRIWTYGLMLAAVSPLAILFSRKIWAQDILPAFSLLIFVGHARRNFFLGAFMWALGSTLIGQIHMSGFFFAFVLLINTIIYDFLNNRKIKIIPILLGGAVGIVPMLPWLIHLTTKPSSSFWLSFENLQHPTYWFYWLVDGIGIHLSYSLGGNFYDFLKTPLIGDSPTFIVAILHVILVAAGMFIIFIFFKKSIKYVNENNRNIISMIKNMSLTNFYLFTAFFSFGFLMYLSGLKIYPHYLITIFPLTYISISKILDNHKKVLIMLIFTQLFVSGFFLKYIHDNGGAPRGDYGVSYSKQHEKFINAD